MDTDSFISTLAAEGPPKPMLALPAQMALWLAGTILWLAVFALHGGLRPDLAHKLNEIYYPPELMLLFGLGVTSAIAALCLSRPDSYQIRWIRFAPFLFLVLWALTAVLNMDPMKSSSFGLALNDAHFDCIGCILAFAVPPGLAMFLMVRHGAPVNSLWAGGMAAGSVAAFAYLGMRVVEQNDNPFHLLIWHALPVLVLCAAGMLAGKIFLRWK
jgi:hypothetical protein